MVMVAAALIPTIAAKVAQISITPIARPPFIPPIHLYTASNISSAIPQCSSKTPVSMYLANKGVKVANLPIIPEIPLPHELHRVPVRKIVGLTISPAKLSQIRQERVRTMGVRGNSDYSELGRIREELAHARKVYRELGADVVDVTDRAVEETAALIIEMVNQRRGPGS